MQHGDLKSLLWGRHLSRMLGVCGVQHLRADPAPRIVPPVPTWYQRTAGILTIAGIVATVHTVDMTLRYRVQPSPWWDGTEAAAFDTTAWTRWTIENGVGAGTAPADSASGQRRLAAGTTLAWKALTEPNGPTVRRRINGILGQGQRFRLIEVTAYTSSTSETDSTPHLTASSVPPRPGTIALSRDLLRTFTPGAPFDFGDKVLIPGVGIFEAHDTMHSRWKAKADIWFASKARARAWGRRTVFVTEVSDNIPTMPSPFQADLSR